MSSCIDAMASAVLPTHALPFGLMPPAAANEEFVKLDTSSATVTSSRKSISRDHVNSTSGPCSS